MIYKNINFHFKFKFIETLTFNLKKQIIFFKKNFYYAKNPKNRLKTKVSSINAIFLAITLAKILKISKKNRIKK